MTLKFRSSALALVLSTALAGSAQAAVLLGGDGTHTNNFDTLAASGQQNTGGLGGWEFLELGVSGNDSYFSTNGGENSGNTFSLGLAGSSDRALGSLVHNNGPSVLQSLIGVQFVNNTGKVITGFEISYAGEQWRLGQTGRGPDRMDFAYRVGTSEQALDAGSFTDVDALDLVAPNVTGAQVRNGNLAANRVLVTGSVNGLNVARGEVLTLRFTDFDIRGANGAQAADDALGIDDFVFTPVLAAVPEPASWAMMIAGFGLAGGAARRRRHQVLA
jgi:hypothetical protein